MAVRKKHGSWYVIYPVGRKVSGQIRYAEKKVGKYKRQADEMDEMLRSEFKKREMLGIKHEQKKKKSFAEIRNNILTANDHHGPWRWSACSEHV